MFSIFLPFYADPKDLPDRLPTKQEIKSSKDILSDQTARIVVDVGLHFAVKYGIAIDPTEGRKHPLCHTKMHIHSRS